MLIYLNVNLFTWLQSRQLIFFFICTSDNVRKWCGCFNFQITTRLHFARRMVERSTFVYTQIICFAYQVDITHIMTDSMERSLKRMQIWCATFGGMFCIQAWFTLKTVRALRIPTWSRSEIAIKQYTRARRMKEELYLIEEEIWYES